MKRRYKIWLPIMIVILVLLALAAPFVYYWITGHFPKSFPIQINSEEKVKLDNADAVKSK